MDQGFVWTPGNGIDPVALARLRSHFGQPKAPMGEAWFMGEERRLFPELQMDLDALSVRELQAALEEIVSGTSAFGPLEEWHDWYHYLLGQLVPRSHDTFVSSLLEILVTGFVTQYPNGIHHPPYPEFRQDVLSTLGRCLMEPQCWTGSEIVVGSFLRRSNNNPNQVWLWFNASGDLSASLFLCLKYLPISAVKMWFRSVLEIESPHWRAQIIVWLVGAHELLLGLKRWPSELEIGAYPSVSWDWSHCLTPELAVDEQLGAPPMICWLPEEACAQLFGEVRSYFTEDVFLAWLESISKVEYLQRELAEIPASFERLYLRAH